MNHDLATARIGLGTRRGAALPQLIQRIPDGLLGRVGVAGAHPRILVAQDVDDDMLVLFVERQPGPQVVPEVVEPKVPSAKSPCECSTVG